MNETIRNFALWLTGTVMLVTVVALLQREAQRATPDEVPFSQLLKEVEQSRVHDVLIQGAQIRGTFTDGRTFQTYAPDDPTLVERLYIKGVSITADVQKNNVPSFVSLLVSWLPLAAIFGAWIFLFRNMQGVGGKALGFGKSRAKLLTEAHGRVTFEDVAGIDEASRSTGDRRIPARSR